MSKYVTVSTTNTWDTKYVTVSNTWAIKDTVTSYFTKYTLCTAMVDFFLENILLNSSHNLAGCVDVKNQFTSNHNKVVFEL